jgi:pantoate--beta-alanine ligase
MVRGGERDSAALRSAMSGLITRESAGVIDYVSTADPESLLELPVLPEAGEVLISVAVRFGSTRLIDNCVVSVVRK